MKIKLKTVGMAMVLVLLVVVIGINNITRTLKSAATTKEQAPGHVDDMGFQEYDIAPPPAPAPVRKGIEFVVPPNYQIAQRAADLMQPGDTFSMIPDDKLYKWPRGLRFPHGLSNVTVNMNGTLFCDEVDITPDCNVLIGEGDTNQYWRLFFSDSSGVEINGGHYTNTGAPVSKLSHSDNFYTTNNFYLRCLALVPVTNKVVGSIYNPERDWIFNLDPYATDLKPARTRRQELFGTNTYRFESRTNEAGVITISRRWIFSTQEMAEAMRLWLDYKGSNVLGQPLSTDVEVNQHVFFIRSFELRTVERKGDE